MLRQLMCLPLLGAVALFGQPAGTGVIAGTVVDHATGAPVRKAVVTVYAQGSPPAWAAQQTDGSGRFQVDSLPAGSFTISAMKEGAGMGSWADTPGQAGKLLTLANGERRNDIVVRLVRPVVVSGVVTDSDGEPITGAVVQMARAAWPRGTRELMTVNQTRTNDRGEYRMVAPVSGRFYLSATAQNTRMMVTPGEMPVGYNRQFQGGTADWKKAAPLVLQSGQQLKGIDFRLEQERMTSIRGRITNLPPMPEAGAPGRGPQMPPLMVQAFGDDDRQSRHYHGAGVNPADGQFQIPNLHAGSYRVTASMQAGDKSFWAVQKVDVKGDVDNVALTLTPAVSLRGKVVMEGDTKVPMSQVAVELTSPMGIGTGPNMQRVTPSADGSFVFDQVPPSIWDINVRPLPKGGFLKSMRLGEQDVLTEEMEIGLKTPAVLQIVVSSRGGTLTGQLAEEARQTRALLVLAPEEKFRHVMSFYSGAPTKADGKFELTGLTPGKYRLYALEMPSTPVDWRNPDLLSQLTAESTPVEIPEGGSVQASPKLIGAARVLEVMP